MNGPVNDNDLTNTLNQRADDFSRLGGHDLDLSQVVSRAGEIRRGRRMRASMMMAAVVVAVAVPVGITVINDDGPNSPHKPPQFATNSPTATTSPTSGASNADPIGISDLPIGDTTEVGFSYDHKLYLPDRDLPLGSADVREIAALRGGFLVARDNGAGDLQISYVGIGDSGTDLTWPYAGSGIAVSAGRNVAAFVDPDAIVHVVQDQGSRNFELGKGKLPMDDYSVDAVVGENCSGRSEQVGCTVYLHSNGENPGIWSVDDHNRVTKLADGFRKISGISSDGDIAGMTRFTESGSCSAVQDSHGKELWSTCDYTLGPFGGSYILGGGPYLSGAGDNTFAVLDAKTGKVVLDLKTSDGAFIADRVWEDGTHAIVTVFDHGKWAIERINVETGERQFAGILDKSGNRELTPTADMADSPFKLG